MNENTFQLFPTDYKVPCQTHQCHGRAAFFIGRPAHKHTGTLQIVCEKCADELVQSIKGQPVETEEVHLLPFEPPEPAFVVEIEGKSIHDMTVKELKASCKALGITGYSDKKEAELITMIEEATNDMAVEEFEGEL